MLVQLLRMPMYCSDRRWWEMKKKVCGFSLLACFALLTEADSGLLLLVTDPDHDIAALFGDTISLQNHKIEYDRRPTASSKQHTASSHCIFIHQLCQFCRLP